MKNEKEYINNGATYAPFVVAVDIHGEREIFGFATEKDRQEFLKTIDGKYKYILGREKHLE